VIQVIPWSDQTAFASAGPKKSVRSVETWASVIQVGGLLEVEVDVAKKWKAGQSLLYA
jgi:hypothetical protein